MQNFVIIPATLETVLKNKPECKQVTTNNQIWLGEQVPTTAIENI